MPTSNEPALPLKVHYTPIDAAIRWSGLSPKEEQEVLRSVRSAEKWAKVELNFERILDAIRNHELPATIDGAPVDLAQPLDDSRMLIRHVDLRSWMIHYYPEHRPTFLFGTLETVLSSSVPIDAVNALLIEREALRAQVQRHIEELRLLRVRQIAGSSRSKPSETLGSRAEATYLHILGSMLALMLGATPTGQRYSRFRSQESIITAMVAENGNLLGISERTLEQKFAAARRAVNK